MENPFTTQSEQLYPGHMTRGKESSLPIDVRDAAQQLANATIATNQIMAEVKEVPSVWPENRGPEWSEVRKRYDDRDAAAAMLTLVAREADLTIDEQTELNRLIADLTALTT